MRLYELRPIIWPRCNRILTLVEYSASEEEQCGRAPYHKPPPSPRRGSDEWLSGVWVVEDTSQQEVLEVSAQVWGGWGWGWGGWGYV